MWGFFSCSRTYETCEYPRVFCIWSFERGRTKKHDRFSSASSASCHDGKAVSFVISLVSVHLLSIVIRSIYVGLHFLLKLYIGQHSHYSQRQLTYSYTQTDSKIHPVSYPRKTGGFPPRIKETNLKQTSHLCTPALLCGVVFRPTENLTFSSYNRPIETLANTRLPNEDFHGTAQDFESPDFTRRRHCIGHAECTFKLRHFFLFVLLWSRKKSKWQDASDMGCRDSYASPVEETMDAYVLFGKV
jgi:hypothetical protein